MKELLKIIDSLLSDSDIPFEIAGFNDCKKEVIKLIESYDDKSKIERYERALIEYIGFESSKTTKELEEWMLTTEYNTVIVNALKVAAGIDRITVKNIADVRDLNGKQTTKIENIPLSELFMIEKYLYNLHQKTKRFSDKEEERILTTKQAAVNIEIQKRLNEIDVFSGINKI